MSLSVVKPTAITPEMLVSTNVPETDYPSWLATTTYAAGARVILASTHKVYESLQAGNQGKSPASEPTFWSEVGPTNRWRLFDLSNTSQTVQGNALQYAIKTGAAVNAVAALNLIGAQSIRIRLTDPVFGLLYDKTSPLVSIPDEPSWYAWFFGERIEQTQHIALDLPSYPNASIQVDLAGTASMAVGVLLLGQLKLVSENMRYGSRMGIRDYSRKEKNDWGDLILVERAYSKTISFPVQIKRQDLDRTHALLSSLRATPCLWVGDANLASMTAFGYPNNFEITISYANYSDCTIDIEGLT